MTQLNSTPNRGDDTFTTKTEGLPDAVVTGVARLHDGDTFELRIFPVRNRISGDDLRMLGYNGSIPGPTIHVDQGSEITLKVRNDGDVEATVHWHGLRLENQYDGVPHETQAPIPIGGTFTYKLQFPDPGIYWYHPHIREDFGLEMGLYGTIVVEPTDAAYWPPVDRHLTVTLDDLLVEDGHIAAFSRSGPTFTAMGRFGNVLLTNGQTEFVGQATIGEVVRLFVVNTANTRIFNFAVRGARMKLVGGDSGRYERETFVEEVLLSPSERAVLDVLFDNPGSVRLEHRTPDHVYDLGGFSVSGVATTNTSASFELLRTDSELSAERAALNDAFVREPDKVISFVSRMPLLYGGAAVSTTFFSCPMHPDVVSDTQGICPECGMALAPAVEDSPTPTLERTLAVYACPMHPDVVGTGPDVCPKCGMKLVLQAGEEPTTTNGPTGATYACPMHPDVIGTGSDTCPKCGMKLVLQAGEEPAPAGSDNAATYACPMHPDVVSAGPDTCPKCGMKLVLQAGEEPATKGETAAVYACPMHPDIVGVGPETCPKCGMKLVRQADAASVKSHAHSSGTGQHEEHHESSDGLEWEDLMPAVNQASNSSNMIWQMIDRETGAINGGITWAFTVGDKVKIRLINEMESDHPMHHPFHIHGAGRFLVLSRDGIREPNLVWKDTVLVRAGQTVDILLDVTNPGLWMAHCHIAEHAQSGMMFSFDVARRS